MPSTLIGAQSGGVNLVSGNPWSGGMFPAGGVQLKMATSNSGNVYVALSGGVTVTSGGALASGGLRDGVEFAPGEPYFIPKLAISGNPQGIFVTCTAATSGFNRVFWEVF